MRSVVLGGAMLALGSCNWMQPAEPAKTPDEKPPIVNPVGWEDVDTKDPVVTQIYNKLLKHVTEKSGITDLKVKMVKRQKNGLRYNYQVVADYHDKGVAPTAPFKSLTALLEGAIADASTIVVDKVMLEDQPSAKLRRGGASTEKSAEREKATHR